MTIDTIYLDMDGVATQWWESASKLFPSAVVPPTGPLSYLVEGHFKCTSDDITRVINEQGVAWWATLPEYPWFDDLYSALLGTRKELIFLTASGHYPHGATGKVIWLQDRFGCTFDSFVITRLKHKLANKSAVLIDDSEKMCESFKNAGGNVVLFPQRWNSNIERMNKPVHFVMDSLEMLDRHAAGGWLHE
jgi:hypothetical protein